MQLLGWVRANWRYISQTKNSNQNEIIIRYFTYHCLTWVFVQLLLLCCDSVGFLGRFWALHLVTSWSWEITEEIQCICLSLPPPPPRVLQKVGFETLVWNTFYNSAVCLWGQCKEPWSSWTKLLFFFCSCKAVSIPCVYKASKAAVCRWSRIYTLLEAVYYEVPTTIVRYFERAKCHWFVYLSVLLRVFRTVNNAHLLLWALLREPVCVAPGSSGCWGALLLAPKPGKQTSLVV